MVQPTLPESAIGFVLIGALLTQPVSAAQGREQRGWDAVQAYDSTQCSRVAAPSAVRSDGRTISGLWLGLPIQHNPWRGTDPKVVAAILQRMGVGPKLADGPPSSRAEGQQMAMEMAAGAEGFAAFYLSVDGQLVSVLAVQSDLEQLRRAVARGSSATNAGRWFVFGKLVVLLGGTGNCRHTIEAALENAGR